jgi:predicted ATPase
MAFIQRFAVTGLAGRDRIEQELDRHVNIFFGLNGSGKTSLLRILQAAMSGNASGLNSVPFRSAEVSIYSEAYKQSFTRRLDKKSPRGRRNANSLNTPEFFINERGQPEFRTGPTLEWSINPELPKDAGGSWAHVYLPISRMYANPTRTQYHLDVGSLPATLQEEQLNNSFAETLQLLWSSYFTEVLDEVRQAQEEGLASILRAVISAQQRQSETDLDPSLAFKRITSFLRRQGSPQAIPKEPAFTKRYLDDPRLRSVVSDIDVIERKIAAATAPRSELQSLIARLFQGKRVQFGDTRISVESNDKKETIDLGLLSSGEKQVLRILVETLRAESNTLLIDEPELSMHIDWQQDLVGIMRQLNPNAQLIMATHSPEVMADVEDRYIFRL